MNRPPKFTPAQIAFLKAQHGIDVSARHKPVQPAEALRRLRAIRLSIELGTTRHGQN